MASGFTTSIKRNESVPNDWRKNLPHTKSQAYLSILHPLECAYAMFGVTLDEAIGMRRQGHVGYAYQVLRVTPALCKKLSTPLSALLRVMTAHARHFGTTPNLTSLDPSNFQGLRSQRIARYNVILSSVLLCRRYRFQYKISALARLVEELGATFCRAAEELGDELPTGPHFCWELLDSSHYDLNTCLRESVVLLKSFLLALPEKQLAEFQAALQQDVEPVGSGSLIAARLRQNLAHRRLAPIKGQ